MLLSVFWAGATLPYLANRAGCGPPLYRLPLSRRNFHSRTFKADEPTGKELKPDMYSALVFQLLFIFP